MKLCYTPGLIQEISMDFIEGLPRVPTRENCDISSGEPTEQICLLYTRATALQCSTKLVTTFVLGD